MTQEATLLGQVRYDADEAVYSGLIESATSNRVYEVKVQAAKAECQCEHSHRRDPMDKLEKWCRHALMLKQNVMGDMVRILRAKFNITWDAQAGAHLFGEVSAAVKHFRVEENRIIRNALLMQAYTVGEANADDVHAMVGWALARDKRIIGSVAGGLLASGHMAKREPIVIWEILGSQGVVAKGQGLLSGNVLRAKVPQLLGNDLELRVEVHVGDKNSERTETNHGRKIETFILTPAGRQLIENALRANQPLFNGDD